MQPWSKTPSEGEVAELRVKVATILRNRGRDGNPLFGRLESLYSGLWTHVRLSNPIFFPVALSFIHFKEGVKEEVKGGRNDRGEPDRG